MSRLPARRPSRLTQAPVPPQVRMREWRHVIRIALGWLLNLSAFVVMLAVFVVYGCTFRSLAADDNSEVEGCPVELAAPLAPCAARQHAPRSYLAHAHWDMCAGIHELVADIDRPALLGDGADHHTGK